MHCFFMHFQRPALVQDCIATFVSVIEKEGAQAGGVYLATVLYIPLASKDPILGRLSSLHDFARN